MTEISSELRSLSEGYADLAILGDEAGCFEIFERAIGTGASMIEIYQDFLGGGMNRIGTWYHTGKIDEAREHMASEITERLMHHASYRFGAGESNGLQALLGGGPDSWHVIGLRMLADVLRHRGWRAMYLGPNVPTLSFVETVRVNKPDLVLLSCSASEAYGGTLNLLHGLKAFRASGAGRKGFLVGVGGLMVDSNPNAFRDAGADFTSPDLKSFVGEAVLDLERAAQVGTELGEPKIERPTSSA